MDKAFAVDYYSPETGQYEGWVEFNTYDDFAHYIKDKKHWRFWVRSPITGKPRFVEDERGPGMK